MLYNEDMKTLPTEARATETITVRVPRGLYSALVAEAMREDRSIAAQLRRILVERYGDAPADGKR